MGLDAYLNQTFTITRRVTGATVDRYNNPVRTTSTIASGVRCRKVQKNMRMVDERTGEYAYVRVNLVLLAQGVSVQPEDVLTIDGVAWRVVTPLTRWQFNVAHHVSCMVEAINGA